MVDPILTLYLRDGAPPGDGLDVAVIRPGAYVVQVGADHTFEPWVVVKVATKIAIPHQRAIPFDNQTHCGFATALCILVVQHSCKVDLVRTDGAVPVHVDAENPSKVTLREVLEATIIWPSIHRLFEGRGW